MGDMLSQKKKKIETLTLEVSVLPVISSTKFNLCNINRTKFYILGSYLVMHIGCSTMSLALKRLRYLKLAKRVIFKINKYLF